MRYVLDTNTCIYGVKQNPHVLARLVALGPGQMALTAITVAELWFGAAKSQTARKTRTLVDAFMEPFVVLDFDTVAAEAYATVRSDLERKGQPIGERDLLIASIALAHGMTVVTNNIREFRRIPTLPVEDWSQPL